MADESVRSTATGGHPVFRNRRSDINRLDNSLINVIHHGDALEILKKYPITQ